MKKLIIFILALLLLPLSSLSCKRIKVDKCECCPCDKKEKKNKSDMSKKHKILLIALVESATGEQLVKALNLPLLENLSNEQLQEIRQKIKQSVLNSGHIEVPKLKEKKKLVPLERYIPVKPDNK